jgi:hypothetical protein
MQSKQPLHRSRSISILPFAFFSAAIGEPLHASKRVKKITFILSGGIFVNQYFFLLLRLWNVDFQASKRDKNDETAGTLFL